MIDITRPGKHTLSIQTPVMNAAGMLGFAQEYASLIALDRLGALVTNPISLNERTPARGTHVVPLDAGTLIHSGLPNAGLKRVIKQHQRAWGELPIPLILHLIVEAPDLLKRALPLIDEVDAVAAVELGLEDGITWRVAEDLITTAAKTAEKPLLARLPFMEAADIADAVAGAGADALVVAAPPRGIARDAASGRLIEGRIYSPIFKALGLRLVAQLCRWIKDVPIIGAGGIHTLQDARDYLEAGAVAVQVDSVMWGKPKMLERIARDLSGKLVTRVAGAFPDEWHPDMGDTEQAARRGQPTSDASAPPPAPARDQ